MPAAVPQTALPQDREISGWIGDKSGGIGGRLLDVAAEVAGMVWAGSVLGLQCHLGSVEWQRGGLHERRPDAGRRGAPRRRKGGTARAGSRIGVERRPVGLRAVAPAFSSRGCRPRQAPCAVGELRY